MLVKYLMPVLLAVFMPNAMANAAEAASYVLTAKDGHFVPETLELPAGQKVIVVVKNDGPGAEEFESSDLNREKVIAPGKNIEVILGPLKAGTYAFFGDFHPSTARGQIIVK